MVTERQMAVVSLRWAPHTVKSPSVSSPDLLACSKCVSTSRQGAQQLASNIRLIVGRQSGASNYNSITHEENGSK